MSYETEKKRFKEFMNKGPSNKQIIARAKKISSGKSAASAMKFNIMLSGLKNSPNKRLSNLSRSIKNMGLSVSVSDNTTANRAKRAKVPLTKVVNGKRVKKTRDELLREINAKKNVNVNRSSLFKKHVNRWNYLFLNNDTFYSMRNDYVNNLNKNVNTINKLKAQLTNLNNNLRAQEGYTNEEIRAVGKTKQVNGRTVKKSYNNLVNDIKNLRKRRSNAKTPVSSNSVRKAYENARKTYKNLNVRAENVNGNVMNVKNYTNKELEYFIKKYRTAVAKATTGLTRAEKKYFSGIDLDGTNDSNYELPNGYDSEEDDAYVDEPDDNNNNNNNYNFNSNIAKLEARVRERFGVNAKTDPRFKSNHYESRLVSVLKNGLPSKRSLKPRSAKNTRLVWTLNGVNRRTLMNYRNQKSMARRRAEVIMSNILNDEYSPKNLTNAERKLYQNIANNKRVLTDAIVSKVLQRHSKNHKQFLRRRSLNS